MMVIVLTGVLAAQATPTTLALPANCRAPDGRYVMSCLPHGTVVKMGAARRLRPAEVKMRSITTKTNPLE